MLSYLTLFIYRDSYLSQKGTGIIDLPPTIVPPFVSEHEMIINRYCQAVGCYDVVEAHKRDSPMDNIKV